MVSTLEICRSAFKYPFSDIKALVMFGIIFVIAGLPNILSSFGIKSAGLISILGIVTLIMFIIIEGFDISVIKETIEGSDAIPSLNPVNNLITGIKAFIITIIYLIIPIIVSIILGIGSFASIRSGMSTNGTASLASNALVGLGVGAFVVIIVLFALFYIFATIAQCRFAKYDSMSEALRIGQVWNDLRAIGIFRFIKWYILVIIFSAVLFIVLGIISAIPYIGGIIAALFISPAIYLFINRALGLLYRDV